MDYSLLVGIYDPDATTSGVGIGAAGDQRANSFDNDLEGDGDGDGEADDENDDSPGNGASAVGGGGDPTPPDSPVVTFQAPMFVGDLDSSLEFYAIKGNECMFRYSFFWILPVAVLITIDTFS
jgi:hypothetical protein